MKKINLKDTTKAKLTARLYTLQRNFNVDNFETTEQIQRYCKGIVKDNFIIPSNQVQNCITDLCLFLLGNTNCKFSKAIL